MPEVSGFRSVIVAPITYSLAVFIPSSRGVGSRGQGVDANSSLGLRRRTRGPWLQTVVKIMVPFGYPTYVVPYYNRDPKMDHNFDNHPISNLQGSIQEFQGSPAS